MDTKDMKPVELDDMLNIDKLRVCVGCGAFIPHTEKELTEIPQCYQCINRHCTIGLNNYMLFKDCQTD